VGRDVTGYPIPVEFGVIRLFLLRIGMDLEKLELYGLGLNGQNSSPPHSLSCLIQTEPTNIQNRNRPCRIIFADIQYFSNDIINLF
jgi:hypothetical protein